MNTPSNIINGNQEAEKLLHDLSKKIKQVYDLHNIRPTLAIILIGNNPASIIYVRNKIKAAEKIGINAIKIELPEDVDNSELFSIIDKLNKDKNVSGIIIQLPIPLKLDKDKILSLILPEKDVDGFHPINVGYLHNNMQAAVIPNEDNVILNSFHLVNTKNCHAELDSASLQGLLRSRNKFGMTTSQHFVPGTALGCLYLAEKYEPNLSGKHVVIVGRSNIVGRPLSALFLNKDCSVTVCHSKTQNLIEITRVADIVVTAIGRPAYFTAEYFNKNAIIIDVGMNRSSNNKLIGDVDFKNVKDCVRYITPVPGGVGPMTVTFLLINTFKAMINQRGYQKLMSCPI